MGKDVPWGTSKLCLAMCPIASRLRNILQKIKSQTRFQICFSRFHILYGWCTLAIDQEAGNDLCVEAIRNDCYVWNECLAQWWTEAAPPKYQDDATCPSCHTHQEDHRHFVRSTHSTRTPWRQTTIDSLSTLLKTHSTNPDLHALIVHGIHETLTTPSYTCDNLLNPHLNSLVQSQNDIGWFQWLNSRVSNEWVICQDYYLKLQNNMTHAGGLANFGSK